MSVAVSGAHHGAVEVRGGIGRAHAELLVDAAGAQRAGADQRADRVRMDAPVG